MKSPVTFSESERLRKHLRLSAADFSLTLGYSPPAYAYALRRRRLPVSMAIRIAFVFQAGLEDLRQRYAKPAPKNCRRRSQAVA